MRVLINRDARFDNALLSTADDYNMVKFLLSRGAKFVSAPGQNLCHNECSRRRQYKGSRLVFSHANDAELDGSRDALNWAAAGGRMDTVKLLIEHGFDFNVTTED